MCQRDDRRFGRFRNSSATVAAQRVVFVHTFLILSPESRMSVSKSLQLQFLLVTRFMRGLTLNASKLSTRSSLVWCFEERGFGFRGRVGV